MTRSSRLLLTGLVVAGSIAGCGGDKHTEQFKDAPRGATNDAAADILEFPDGFSNVSAKCDGPNRVYVVFHEDANYGSVAVVANDPRCSTPKPAG